MLTDGFAIAKQKVSTQKKCNAVVDLYDSADSSCSHDEVKSSLAATTYTPLGVPMLLPEGRSPRLRDDFPDFIS